MSSSEGLHFIEVKQRKTLELAAQSISHVQKKRITQAAEAFLVEYIQPYSFISFDVVLICSQNNIEHLPHAFESEY
jgi:Holliday junction resolvase-like predicted endonuclease